MSIIHVRTEDDLYAIRDNPYGHYQIENDITLTKWQTGEGWLPIEEFYGLIDGKGHTIHGLYINRPDMTNVGFISHLERLEGLSYRDSKGVYGVGVTNLNFSRINILGGSSTGSIAGNVKGYGSSFVDYFGNNYSSAQPVSIINCKVDGSLRSSANNFGGVVGFVSTDVRPTKWDNQSMINLNLYDSHVNINMYAFGNNVGGLVGNAEQGGINVLRSSSKGNIYNANVNIGGLIGYVNGGRGFAVDSYSKMNIQGSNYIGGIIGRATKALLPNGAITRCYFAGTIDAPNSSSVNISAGLGYWDDIVNGDENGSVIYDEEKAQLRSIKYIRANVKKNGVTGYTTAEMANPITYHNHGFRLFEEWFDDLLSNTDTLQLKSELDPELLTLDGLGTEENPYLINDIYGLLAMYEYNKQNWLEYNRQLADENTFTNPNFKEDYNFSPPNRYHYKLLRDIDLDIYPFNEVGWKPIANLRITKPNEYTYYNSIGEFIGRTSDGGKTFTDRAYLGDSMLRIIQPERGFMGVFDGNDFSIKNLALKDNFHREYNATSYGDSEERVGFFGILWGATVKNVRFENVRVESKEYGGRRKHDDTYDMAENVRKFGVIAGRSTEDAKVERVIIDGESHLTDYRSDVGSAKGEIAGIVHSMSNTHVKDVAVKLRNTILNVDPRDTNYKYFFAFASHINSETLIEKSYSTSSNKAVDRFGNDLGNGNHGSGVLIGTDVRNKDFTILSTYYDRDIANAELNDLESYREGEVEIHGVSTSAMYLQATYEGWNFDTIWEADGLSYPKLQLLDPNYVPPKTSTTYSVVTSLDSLDMSANASGVTAKHAVITVGSVARKATSDTSVQKKGTTHAKTDVERLYMVAFQYLEPKTHTVTVETEVLEVGFESDSLNRRRRENLVSTVIENLNFESVASGVNKGEFYNSIEIDSIRPYSISIRVNDTRIRMIEMTYGINKVVRFDRNGDSRYLVINLEPTLFSEGYNNVSINGLDEFGDVLDTRRLRIERYTPPFMNLTNRYIIINDEYYTITSHTNDGVMTLDRNITERTSRRLEDGQLRIVESIEYQMSPKVSAGGRRHERNFVEGELVRVKRTEDEVTEEYEFDVEGGEVVTEIDFSRNTPITNTSDTPRNNGAIEVFDVHFDEDSPDLGTRNLNAILRNVSGSAPISDINALDEHTYEGGTVVIRTPQHYALIRVDVNRIVRQKINQNYSHSTFKHLDLTFRWYGYRIIQSMIQYANGVLFPEPVEDMMIYQDGQFRNVEQSSSYTGMRDSDNRGIYKTEISVSGTKYAGFDGYMYFLITAPKLNYVRANGEVYPEDISTTYIGTNFIEVDINAPDQNESIPILNDVRQVYIPKFNNDTIID